MIDELGNITDVDIFLVSPVMSTPTFTLIENDYFFTALSENVVFDFSPISRRVRVELQISHKFSRIVCFGACTVVWVSTSKLQVLILSSSRDLTP